MNTRDESGIAAIDSMSTYALHDANGDYLSAGWTFDGEPRIDVEAGLWRRVRHMIDAGEVPADVQLFRQVTRWSGWDKVARDVDS
jgi:hypothetical protein